MNPHDEMDITAYLQTEGRRLAAELATAAAAARAQMALPQARTAEPKPLQADAGAGSEPLKSLGEVLQGMGVIRKPPPRDLKSTRPGGRSPGTERQTG